MTHLYIWPVSFGINEGCVKFTKMGCCGFACAKNALISLNVLYLVIYFTFLTSCMTFLCTFLLQLTQYGPFHGSPCLLVPNRAFGCFWWTMAVGVTTIITYVILPSSCTQTAVFWNCRRQWKCITCVTVVLSTVRKIYGTWDYLYVDQLFFYCCTPCQRHTCNHQILPCLYTQRSTASSSSRRMFAPSMELIP